MVNALVEVLDEDVPNTALTETGITLRPHHSAWPALDRAAVKGIQSTLG